LSISRINRIILAVKGWNNTSDQRHSKPNKTNRNPDIIAAVAASLEENRHFTVRELATRHGLTVWVVYQILTVDLGLVKKLTRWVPKLLSPWGTLLRWMVQLSLLHP
jgi:hypothetical protein